MIRSRLLSLCFILYPFLLSAQAYDTTSYDIRFVAYDIGMWNSGPTDILPAINKDFSFSWDESVSVGGMESVLGMDFGAEFYGKTAGTVGMGFYMSEINGGMIDSIVYPIKIEFLIPEAADIRAGQTIRILSNVEVNEEQMPSIETTFPMEGKIGVSMLVDLETDLGLEVCAFDACLDMNPKSLHNCVGDIMDFTFDEPLLEISTLGPKPQITVPELGPVPCLPDLSFHIPCVGKYDPFGDFNYWPSTRVFSPFPIEFNPTVTLKSKHPLSKYQTCLKDTANSFDDCVNAKNVYKTLKGKTVLKDFLKGYMTLPFIDTLYTTATRNRLVSVGSDEALSMSFYPAMLVGGGKFLDGSLRFPIPCTGGDIFASYMLASPSVSLQAELKQEMTFDAAVVVTLELPAELSYRVKDKSGRLIKSGNSDRISYEVGNDLFVDFPCSYEYIDFKPTFRVENKLNNRTYTSIGMDGRFKALEVGIGMDDITVVPEITLCIPNPFGDDWCTTIPAVTFGFDASVGPLIDVSISQFMSDPDDMELDIDIFNESWEVQSFQQIPAGFFRVAPTRFTTHVEADTIECFGTESGLLEAMNQGGSPPFSYLWSDKSTGKQAPDLAAGDHYVRVTDANGCVAFNGAKIYEYPELLILEEKLRDPECYGETTGGISFLVEGGRPPYSYAWSNGSNATVQEALPAGSYSVTVSDANACRENAEFELLQPPELTAYVNHKRDLLCNGVNTGSIKLNVSGGTPGYDFHWSNGAISKDVDSLYAGLYRVKVVDRNNCFVELEQQVGEPPLLELDIELHRPVSCFQGYDGELLANIRGGVEPYDIAWYGPRHQFNHYDPVLTGLAEGTYQVALYDANACYRLDTFYLESPAIPFSSTLTEHHLSCKGASNGRFELDISGGQAPYSFSWSDGSTNRNRQGLAAGPYSVEIRDAMDCLTHNNMVLLEPPALKASFSMTAVSCPGQEDGALEVFPKGGTPPYAFSWSSGSLEQLAAGLAPGEHSLLLSDSRGCTEAMAHEVEVDGSQCFDIPNSFTPNGDGYNDTWVLKDISITYPAHLVHVISRTGNVLYAPERGAYQPWDGTFKGSDVPGGTYFYIIDPGDGREPLQGTVTIVR